VKQLNGQDASFLYLESEGAHLHLTALYVYEQPEAAAERLTYEDIVRHVNSRLETSGIFRQKLVRPPFDMDYPYWVDDARFDLEQHMHRYQGPVPANLEQLDIVVAVMHSEPLDLARPPWEMHILEDLGSIKGLPNDCFAIVAKYHHAAIDGASGSQLVDGLHDTRPGKIRQDKLKPWVPGPEPGVLDFLTNAAVNNVREPIKLIKSLAGAVPGMLSSALTSDEEEEIKSGPVPKTRFNGPVGPKRIFHSRSINLDDVRLIKKAIPGATVNDVILAICGGGLRSWLENRQELPGESLFAMVPVNARSSDEVSLGGNKLATLFIPIHTDISNPLARLRAIHKASSAAKSTDSGVDAQQMSEIPSHIPAIALSASGQLITRLGLGHRAIRLANCTITNVPGPQKTLYLGPARLVFSAGSAPIIDGMGLLISAFSYEGKITFSFTSCPEMLPDSEWLGECTQNAFELLLQQVG